MHKVYDLLLVWYFLSIPIYISSFAATQCYLYNFFLFKIYEGSTIFQNILDEGGSCVAWKVGTRLILSFYGYTIYLFDFNQILATCFSIKRKKKKNTVFYHNAPSVIYFSLMSVWKKIEMIIKELFEMDLLG